MEVLGLVLDIFISNPAWAYELTTGGCVISATEVQEAEAVLHKHVLEEAANHEILCVDLAIIRPGSSLGASDGGQPLWMSDARKLLAVCNAWRASGVPLQKPLVVLAPT